MRKFLKLILGIGGCIFYYMLFCMILGADFGDPWNKMVSWVKGEKTDNKKDNNKISRKYIKILDEEE